MTTHDDTTVDVPETPAPRVREFAAHSIGGGLAPLLGLLGLFAGAGMVAGATAISAAGGKGRADRRRDRGRSRHPPPLSTSLERVELAAVVVWRVEDTAQATFEVDDYVEFVSPQTEAAVRHIAIEYPYDAHDEGGLSLRGNGEEITEKLALELHARVEAAGVQIIESRFTHLAYAPEIASAMLQRQQAGAVAAARRQIVDGAVGMVEAAPARISEQDIVELDDERKAAMVSNLMVVLCGDRAAQPVLNTGTLFQ